ncbi:MAG: alpha/beta hydrolase [Firmicutes bacterium]|nr:alpha/beta hydrolase [Bacillota bacterium]
MNKREFYYPSVDGMTKIHSIIWEPEGEPKAVLQIIHGMIEYIDRYDDFAKFLADKGYVVVGEDHLGHGASVVNDSYHGYFGENGNQMVIDDIHQLRTKMQAEYEGIPYIMMGHSMGSFLIRQYITEKDSAYADELAGVIVMGTGWQPGPVLAMGKAVAAAQMKLKGARATSKMIEAMAFGSYLKRIKKPNTVSDWLTKDTDIVRAYRRDPWCTFHFTTNGFYNMFLGMQKAQDTKRIQTLPAGLPILFVAGTEDPVGNYGEGVRKTFMVYKDNTECQIDIKLYEGDRHEIINELDRDVVYADLLEWLDACVEDRR